MSSQIAYFEATDGGRVEIDKIKLVSNVQHARIANLYYFEVFTFEGAMFTSTYDTYFEAMATREALVGLLKWQS